MIFFLATCFVPACFIVAEAQMLKSIVYDFDGFDAAATNFPEGDYSYGDLSYSAMPTPPGTGSVMGDRVLKIQLNWNDGYGTFGRGISRYLELTENRDRLNFYFYNGPENATDALVEIRIADDDNQSEAYENTADDLWTHTLTISQAQYWQLIEVPLADLTDSNTGGNGNFDIGFEQNEGMLLLLELRFTQPQAGAPLQEFYVDMICFSEDALPRGNAATDPPPKQPGDYCLLGVHQYEKPGEFYMIPQHFHADFPTLPGRKIQYVNTYMQWATNGSTKPHMLPGMGYQKLLDDGYLPVITWEPMFSGFSYSDAVQPDFNKILAGTYDSYLGDFAKAVKALSDTVIVRLMHEFDGGWYPWCIANNQQDPQKYAQAYRYIVDKVRQVGAPNILWMWCPNSDFVPQKPWNRITDAYPGDNYVNIVATDVYNAHYPQPVPRWRSFRWQYAEISSYLSRYYPHKPLFICELACRERSTSEPFGSQDKAGWLQAMDHDLQSYFRNTRALVFFNEDKTQEWSVNSSGAALNAVRDHIWNDDYYFLNLAASVQEGTNEPMLKIVPNPATDHVRIVTGISGPLHIVIRDALGKVIDTLTVDSNSTFSTANLSPGIYYVSFGDAAMVHRCLIVN